MEENTARFSELRCREVINLYDGARLGYVSDMRLDLCEGRVLSILVPLEKGVLGLLAPCEDLEIPWCNIDKIGEDIIFVRFERPCPPPKSKEGRFFGFHA